MMNKLQMVKTAISRTAGRTGLVINKYSPEILIGAGVIGIVGSTVMACKATLKVDEILADRASKLEKINEVKETFDKEKSEGKVTNIEYTDKDYKKDLTVVYIQSGVKIIKLYAPAVLLGAASIGFIFGAHNIMRKRNVALLAAYKAVEGSFAKYRKRVVEEHGEDADRMYKNGIKTTTIDKEEIDKKGNVKYSEQTVEVIDPNGISQYARFFDESSKEWTKTPEYNLTFLKCQQSYANDLLHARGHVFLNEVYDMLGIDRSQAGAVVGWVKGQGDDFIDFGIFSPTNERAKAFVNGYERSILLDFNVSGVIYDMI